MKVVKHLPSLSFQVFAGLTLLVCFADQHRTSDPPPISLIWHLLRQQNHSIPPRPQWGETNLQGVFSALDLLHLEAREEFLLSRLLERSEGKNKTTGIFTEFPIKRMGSLLFVRLFRDLRDGSRPQRRSPSHPRLTCPPSSPPAPSPEPGGVEPPSPPATPFAPP